MPGIWNINSVYDVNTKRISKKLSFEIGENFLARVVNLDKLTGELLLKLLDGWQFSAKLEKNMESLPQGLIRFEVEGFEDGKLKLKLVSDSSKENKTEKDSINSLLKENSADLEKNDYTLLSKMIKHNIPLTRENLSNVKNIIDFMGKIKQDNNEEEVFISKYIQSKNIDTSSNEGKEIRNTLKSFFNELKGLTEDDVLTFFENSIDITEKNIKSFNNIFKDSLGIYNSIRDIEETMKASSNEIENSEGFNDLTNKGIISDTEEKSMIKPNIVNESKDIHNSASIQNSDTKSFDDLTNKSIINDVEKENIVKSNIVKEPEDTHNSINMKNDDTKNVISYTDKDNINPNGEEKTKEILSNLEKSNKNNSILTNNIDEIAKSIKEQVSSKTEELKNVINKLLENKTNTNGDIYNTISQALDRNINDMKIFNQVSNQYYYLDLPINLNNNQYECKLMIKDERKKGKKIDSTNVKIAASVNTINMGVVDAYIRLNNSNMDIDIKCNNQWIKVLDKSKESILEGLSKMGYNAYVKISEKQEEMNIVNCREFFEDNNLGMLDTKV
ncbi:hypothetical protein [Clostridium sp. DJ247]|uniref:hypothetical protein n=1 Tax=Clostridium sp. DJ247 TaxID=2726188 RepID=UPI001625AFBB|nr:hypothetical protein [Clostridium sp. DJ247]MBC2582234.1 hypothetical protein [Clostridium sp. DJ247]